MIIIIIIIIIVVEYYLLLIVPGNNRKRNIKCLDSGSPGPRAGLFGGDGRAAINARVSELLLRRVRNGEGENAHTAQIVG